MPTEEYVYGTNIEKMRPNSMLTEASDIFAVLSAAHLLNCELTEGKSAKHPSLTFGIFIFFLFSVQFEFELGHKQCFFCFSMFVYRIIV